MDTRLTRKKLLLTASCILLAGIIIGWWTLNHADDDPAPTPPPYTGPMVEPEVVAIPQEPVLYRKTIQFSPDASEEDRRAYIEAINGVVVGGIDALDVVIVSVPVEGSDQPLPDSPIVIASEPDFQVAALESPVNDPRYGEQWALPLIGAPEAWAEIPTDSPMIPLAVIDSGIVDHPDLEGRIADNGWDFVEDDAIPQDEFGHGTAVASVIAANHDDGIGMAGVAPNAQIMPLKVLDSQGIGTYSDVASAIVYAVDNGAQVINLSLGGLYPSAILEEAIRYADERGVIIVAAAGNNASESLLYPAAYDAVIAVGSVDPDLRVSSFSNYGEIDLWAPGRDILVAMRDGDYALMSGTSLAAPHVAGVALLEINNGTTLNISNNMIVGFSSSNTEYKVILPGDAPATPVVLQPQEYTVKFVTPDTELLPDGTSQVITDAMSAWTDSPPKDNTFSLISVRMEETWGLVTLTSADLESPLPEGEEIHLNQSNLIVLLLVETKEGWQAAIDVDGKVHELLTFVPEAELSLSAKEALFPPQDLIRRESVYAMQQYNNYKLPWPAGFSWQRTNGYGNPGWHGSAGTSLDFDIFGTTNSTILASASGSIYFKCPDSSKQTYLMIKTDSTSEILTYLHLDKASVNNLGLNQGDHVNQGQSLGKMVVTDGTANHIYDGCGTSKGTHIHLIFPTKPFTIDGYTFTSSYTYQGVHLQSSQYTDTTAPTISISTAMQTNNWYNSTPSISWTIQDNSGGSGVAGYCYAWDNAFNLCGYSGRTNGSSGSTTLPASPGNHTLYVRAFDKAQNKKDVSRGPFGFDDLAPVLIFATSCGAQDGIWQNSCNAPVFTGSASESHSGLVTTYKRYFGQDAADTDPNNPTWQSTTSLNYTVPGGTVPANSEGIWYYRLWAQDQLGNDAVTTFELRYDGIDPAGNLILNNGADFSPQTSIAVSLAVDAGLGSAVDSLRLSGNLVDWSDWTAYADAFGWLLPAVDTTHTVYAQVTDEAGNTAQLTDTILLDRSRPNPTSDSYWLVSSVMDSSGPGQASASYQLLNSVGQPFNDGVIQSGSYTLWEGFLSGSDALPLLGGGSPLDPFLRWAQISNGGGFVLSANFGGFTNIGYPFYTGQPVAMTSASYQMTPGILGDIDITDPSSITLPTPANPPNGNPTGLGGSVISLTQIDLAWTDNSTNETSFRIQRSFDGNNPWIQVGSASTDTMTFSHTGLSCGTSYYYRVLAHNSDGYSQPTNTFNATTNACPIVPAAPTGLSAADVAGTAVDLTWTDNASDEDDYRVERAGGGQGNWSSIASIAVDSISYTDTTVTCGADYDYRVIASNSAGDSAVSNTGSVSTSACPLPDGDPADLLATVNERTQVDLSWTDGSSNEDGFTLQWSNISASGPWTNADLSPDTVSYSHTGLVCATNYYYQLTAYNAGGTSATISTNALTDACPTVPGQPTGIAPSGLIADNIPEYSWNEVLDATEYRLQVGNADGGVIDVVYEASAVCATGICSVTPSTTLLDDFYTWQVQASSALGDSAWNETLSFVVDSTAPVDPSIISSTSHSEDQISNLNLISIEWSEDGHDGNGVGIAGYSVLWDANPSTAVDAIVDMDVLTFSQSSPPLADGSWYFHFSTCDVAGNCSTTQHLGPFIIDGTAVCYTLGLTIQSDKEGTVDASPMPNCNNSQQYIDGTVVDLTAIPNANKTFMGWTGLVTSMLNDITVTMDGDKALTALFGQLADNEPPNIVIDSRDPISVTITVAGELTNACQRLNPVEQVRDGDSIWLWMTTRTRSNKACSATAKPYAVDIKLDGVFLSGVTYNLYINGELYTFTIP